MSKYSFKKGYEQLQLKDVELVREKIMNALNIKTLQGFRYRLAGVYEPKVSEVESIEKIFGEYGITDIWGKSHETESTTNPA